MTGSRLHWYWHRLRAMGPAEVGGHVRKKLFQFADARRTGNWPAVSLEPSHPFPQLPGPAGASAILREALRRDAEDILAGRWRAFGHLEIQVDDPPRWHTDYFAGQNLATTESAFKLNHRELPDGADIKLIWELSRWYQLVRLAQASHVLGDLEAGRKCVEWLQDWVIHNPPYRGWNWTSALESGLRLVQFTWIDALLQGQGEAGGYAKDLQRLRSEILAPHVWFTWRHRTFGSSANNHLLGELAGLILATVRWPVLAKWGTSLETLQALWEREVLAQFAEDGGNCEQALNYQLFSWEFCWQVRTALLAAGRKIQPGVEARLADAARFFWEVQATKDIWDYGDSDNGYVTPFFSDERAVPSEWREWMEGFKSGAAINYWLGQPPSFTPPLGRGQPAKAILAGEWWVFHQSGIALCESGFWWLRWDLSPLGYLQTAAHGHFDALHLSIWFKRVALVIDPGTGAYYADRPLRTWLASREAHNGPCPVALNQPKRLGPFLWSEHHEAPTWRREQKDLIGEMVLPQGQLKRRIQHSEDGLGWQVDDACENGGRGGAFTVRWQFAPGVRVKRLEPRRFSVSRADVSVVIEVDENWAEVRMVETESDRAAGPASSNSLEGVVSPSFRHMVWAPYLKLTAPGGEKPCVFRTTFLASARS